ncbi:hypothetical protein ACOMHN_045197 [Nucella lapillus]
MREAAGRGMAGTRGQAVVSLLVWTVCLTCCHSTPDCTTSDPATCPLAGTFCHWENSNWISYPDNIATACNSNHSATLLSPLACSNDGKLHCLSFQFYAFGNTPNTMLDVVVREGGKEQVVWRVTSSNKTRNWTTGSVLVDTKSDFRLTLRATFAVGRQPITLRHVQYNDTVCELTPPDRAFVPAGVNTQTTTPPPRTSGAEGGPRQTTAWKTGPLIAMLCYGLYL